MKIPNAVCPGCMEAIGMPNGGADWEYSVYDPRLKLMYSKLHNAWILDADRYGDTNLEADLLLVPAAFSYKDVPECYIVIRKELLRETLASLMEHPAGIWGCSAAVPDYITSFQAAVSDDLPQIDGEQNLAGLLSGCETPNPGPMLLELVRRTLQCSSMEKLLLGMFARNRLFVWCFERDFLPVCCEGEM